MSEWDVIIPSALVFGPFTAIVVALAGIILGLVALVRGQPPTFSVALAALWLGGYGMWATAGHFLAPFWSINSDGLDAVNIITLVLASIWLIVAIARTRLAPG